MTIRKYIPNTLTCCNLLCGVVAIFAATQQLYALCFLLIIGAAGFDFLDGFSARLLKVSCPMGKELDSLADVVTFGVAPAVLLMKYLHASSPMGWFSLIVLLMAAFAALRLAKFNLDLRQLDSFIGLATPANAIFWASLITVLDAFVGQIPLWGALILVAMCLGSCYLLVSEIPFFALKFHNFHWADNRIRYIFLIGGVVLLLGAVITSLVVKEHKMAVLVGAGAVVVIWYLLFSFVTTGSKKA